jgi:hypothetical protein
VVVIVMPPFTEISASSKLFAVVVGR